MAERNNVETLDKLYLKITFNIKRTNSMSLIHQILELYGVKFVEQTK